MLEGRDRGQILAGGVVLLVGLFFMLMSLGDPSMLSAGVPRFVGVGAGGAFFMAGVVVVRTAIVGAVDDLVNRVLAATLLSAFAAASMIFPPSGLFVGFLAVLGWIFVYRRLHERATGHDPFAGWSDGRQIGFGCLVTIILCAVVFLVSWLLLRAPAVPLLPERMP